MRAMFGFGKKDKSNDELETEQAAYSPFVCCVCNRSDHIEVFLSC